MRWIFVQNYCFRPDHWSMPNEEPVHKRWDGRGDYKRSWNARRPQYKFSSLFFYIMQRVSSPMQDIIEQIYKNIHDIISIKTRWPSENTRTEKTSGLWAAICKLESSLLKIHQFKDNECLRKLQKTRRASRPSGKYS